MRWPILAGVCLAACGAGRGQVSGPGVQAAGFATRLSSPDVTVVRTLLRENVVYGGIWFSDAACASQFSAPGTLEATQLDAFARCLTTLELSPAGRTDELPDIAMVTYAPGLELQVQFAEDGKGPWLRRIGYVAADSFNAPTIASTTLEGLRTAGAPDGPFPDNVDLADELASTPFVWSWLRVCLDGEGAITSADVREATSPRVGRLALDAVKGWKFKPFTVGDKPMAACSLVRLAYPSADSGDEVLPLTQASAATAEPITVPTTMLGTRKNGSTNVVPDNRTKLQIEDSSSGRLVSAWQFCLDANGKVTRVVPIRATGFADYDKQLSDAIKGWEYPPFRDEGTPVAVCSSIRFVYSQK